MTQRERTEAVLAVYTDSNTSDEQSALINLLADMMLVHGLENVESDIETARIHYEAEKV